MKIYHAVDDEGDGEYFSNKKAAIKAARAMAKAQGGVCEVIECEVMPGKAGILALANGPGWCLKQTTVFMTPVKITMQKGTR